MQRLLEIDTYRMLALLILPMALVLAPVVTRCERDLADITTALANASDVDEPVLLERLSRLEAEIGSQEAANHYCFAAASACYDLAKRRIEELGEERGMRRAQHFSDTS